MPKFRVIGLIKKERGSQLMWYHDMDENDIGYAKEYGSHMMAEDLGIPVEKLVHNNSFKIVAIPI